MLLKPSAMSMDLNLSADPINCSFISEKVAKVRFIHEKYKQSDTFVTGGWGSDTNAITLWKLTKESLANEESDIDYMPKSISKIPIDGEVTGLELFNSGSIACSTSSNDGKFYSLFIRRLSCYLIVCCITFTSSTASHKS